MDAGPAVSIGAASDQGRQRTENQDSLATPPPNLSPKELSQKGVLCLVADGIGGHRAGKQASDLVARRVTEEYYGHPPGDVPRALRRAIRTANIELHRLAQELGHEKMGTTIVAAVLHGETLTVAHVGDSRAYLLSPDQAQLLTRDHTWVAEQLDDGILTQEQADRHSQRHVLTRSLGARPEVVIDVIHTSLRPGDLVLLCSDGLWETVGLAEIEAIARSSSPQQAASQLVDLANENGGADNITVVLARPDLGPAASVSPLPSTGMADRLGEILARILPAEGGKRWLILAAAVLLVVLAVACALTLLLGGLPPGREDRIPSTQAAPLGTPVNSSLPGPGDAGALAPEASTTAATATQASIQGRVLATVPLALRQGPQLSGALLAYLTPDSILAISCQTLGDVVDGEDTWYRVTAEGSRSGYATARWIEPEGVDPHAIPSCPDRN